MHILLYSPQFLPSVGGLQNVVHYWAEAVTRMGYRVTVLTHTAAGEKDDYNYQVVRNPGRRGELQLMRKCDKVIMFNVSLKALPQWLLSGKPLYISHHTALRYEGMPLDKLQRLKLMVASYLAKKNVACSKYVAREYKNCQVVHSPYDPSVFYSQFLHRKPGSIIAVGRLVSDKGIDTLIKAFALLAKKVKSELRLTIVGDGPDRKLLEGLVLEQRLESRVGFTGSLPANEVAGLLNQHEMMVIPSRMEPFGIVVLEGMACGCKMLVSNQGGLPEAAGELATLFPPDNPAALATAMEQTIGYESLFDDEAINSHLINNNIQNTARQMLDWING